MMLDGFLVRNGFRERLVTKLKEREYHGRKAGGLACLGGGLGYERLRLKGVRRMAAWERGLWVSREEEAGRWREGFWGGGV